MAVSERERGKTLWQKAVTISRSRCQIDRKNCDKEGTTPRHSETGTMSFQKIAINLFETKKLLEKDKELKSKNEEIEVLKRHLCEQQDGRQKLEKKMADVCKTELENNQKMAQAQEMAHKLKTENKKMADFIEKLERNISHMEDRMRNLEIRASEVEKTEIALEITKKNLESCQVDLKIKESELEKEKEKYEEKCRELNEAKNKITDLESKIGDLKFQIRHELMKNENIEKDLETIPRLQDEIKENQGKITSLEKELSEKTLLLNSSRKCFRELQEKLKEVDNQEEKCHSLQEELDLVQSEVTTLKKLMSSKDVLVQHRCSQLEQAKAAVDSLCHVANSVDEEKKLKQINHVLSKLQQFYLQCLGQDDLTKEKVIFCGRSKSATNRELYNSKYYTTDDSHKNKENSIYLDLTRLTNDTGKPTGSKSSTSSTGSGSLVQRSASFHHFTHGTRGTTSDQTNDKSLNSPSRVRRSESPYQNSTTGRRNTKGVAHISEMRPKLSCKLRPSLDDLNSDQGNEERRNTAAGFRNTRPVSSYAVSKGGNSQNLITSNNYPDCCPDRSLMSKSTKREQKILASISPNHLDAILSDVIRPGDRVTVDIAQKPPRYGRKEAKPITYSGIVKFIGPVDEVHKDSTLYVGIRLDEPIGDTDGLHKGTRYMFTPPGYTKFCKLRDLDTIFHVSSSQYIPVTKLVVRLYEDYIDNCVETDQTRKSINMNSHNSPNQSSHE